MMRGRPAVGGGGGGGGGGDGRPTPTPTPIPTPTPTHTRTHTPAHTFAGHDLLHQFTNGKHILPRQAAAAHVGQRRVRRESVGEEGLLQAVSPHVGLVEVELLGAQ